MYWPANSVTKENKTFHEKTKPESDEESSLETISNSSKEESVSNDEESIIDNDNLLEKADKFTPAAGDKR